MSTEPHPSAKPEGAASTATAAKQFDWFDRPESRRLLWRLLWGACIVFVLLEIPLFLAHKRHSHFEFHGHGEEGGHAAPHGVAEAAADASAAAGAAAASAAHHSPTIDGWWFFYAILGFVGCAVMILAAKLLGFVLKRPEDYYDRDDGIDSGNEPLPEDIDDALR